MGANNLDLDQMACYESGSTIFCAGPVARMHVQLVIRSLWVRPPQSRLHSFMEIDYEILPVEIDHKIFSASFSSFC